MSDPSRRDVLRGAGLAAMASMPVITSSAGLAGGEVPERPRGVHIAYGPDPASTMTVGWSGPPATGPVVRYGEPGAPKTTVSAESTPVPGKGFVTYAARLIGLDSQTTYEYEVDLDGATRGPFTFETAPDSGDSFRVTAVGDHGIADPDNPGQRANTDDPERVMDAAFGQDPAFQLLVGDISYANGKPSTWELYFDTFEEYFARHPFMTVPGNHEAEPGTGLAQYDGRLNDLMPTYDPRGADDLQHEPRWYDFHYGNAAFIGLSTTTDACGDVGRAEEYIPIYDPRCELDGQTYGEAQEQYLREALQRAEADDDVTWKVVYFHGPFWTDSPDHAPRRDLRKRWGTLFDEYDVDLVLSGDNHVWERTKPIRSRPDQDDYGADDAWEWDETDVGTTFVTNGTGGTSHYAFASPEPSDFLARRTNEHFGVAQLDVGEAAIEVSYVTQDGSVADRFRIQKDAEGRPVQRGNDDAVATGLQLSGTRTDDGRLFTAGQTNQVDLTVEASESVAVRDRIPASWEVLGGDLDRSRAGGAVEPADGDTKWVYLDADDGSATYFVEAPEGPEQTGQYAFGPFQARPADGETGWQVVSGTEGEATVVGASQSTFGL
ncbi:metallophosphoesterase [Halorarius litoreus]|uniref:metallophosphoesterase n=1 Tax=Halorarius litoreus TaxID=2962676 RepID=UPI0020CF2F40|nr:metallophosphoesterase family protein [Halorarius litoreus]